MSTTSDPPQPYEQHAPTSPVPLPSPESSYDLESIPGDFNDDYPTFHPAAVLVLVRSPHIGASDISEGSLDGANADDEFSLHDGTCSESSVSDIHFTGSEMGNVNDEGASQGGGGHSNSSNHCTHSKIDRRKRDGDGIIHSNSEVEDHYGDELSSMEGIAPDQPEGYQPSYSSFSKGKSRDVNDIDSGSPMSLDIFIHRAAPEPTYFHGDAAFPYLAPTMPLISPYRTPEPGPSRMYYPPIASASRVRANPKLVLRYDPPSSRHHPYKRKT
ncbi:hypothetical protein FRC06_000781 [Ceratobasidium sp. 370]|nr:hypothetical protein FRC06_000781 [Ceratobasidium sp. 370]